MSLSSIQGSTVDVRIWAPIHEVESAALSQLRNIASLPWVYHHVAAMPDVHLGKGATVGSVVAMKGAVAPAAVGVDIGCGMIASKTSLTSKDLPESLKSLRMDVERAIPVGFNQHTETFGIKDLRLRKVVANHFESFRDLHSDVQDRLGKAQRQIGTLGGGNHFIELCLDTEDGVWLMMHSGSRNIGKEIAEAHIRIARTLEHNQKLPDKDLSVFLASTEEMNSYRHDLYWAQQYAWLNRAVMMEIYLSVLSRHFPHLKVLDTVQAHHNYVAEEIHYGEEVFVTRKGAISAGEGVMGIIPGSMGQKSYIVRGRGNPESFMSASHGAGRKMSRGAAKRTFTLEDLAAQTEGVECRKDAGVLDEIPGAYKDIDTVMDRQKDLVDVVAEIRAIMTVKG